MVRKLTLDEKLLAWALFAALVYWVVLMAAWAPLRGLIERMLSGVL
ncbi:MAG: hypothetical protein WC759_01670 [Candidatus Micrarchaeia archaeon]|jgi:hypothetical protein